MPRTSSTYVCVDICRSGGGKVKSFHIFVRSYAIRFLHVSEYTKPSVAGWGRLQMSEVFHEFV